MSNGEHKPTPDPTVLTTEQLLREIQTLKEWTAAMIAGSTEICDEKFSSVTKQFVLIERQRVEQKADTEKAVQAALSAAKEAVKEQTAASEKSIDKAQTATAEQLKQQGTTFTTAVQSQERQHNDLKERVGNIEAGMQGVNAYRTDRRDINASVLAVVGSVVGILVLVVGIYATFHR
jgi:hypothetical protein